MKHGPAALQTSILIITFFFATGRAFAFSGSATTPTTTPSYSQGYEDGYIYTAQQTGKGCKNRLSQAAVDRLNKSIKVNAVSADSGDFYTLGDGDSDGANGAVRSFADYNQGKLQGMGDAMSAPNEVGDLCTNGD